MLKQSLDERRYGMRAKRILSIQYRLHKTKAGNNDRNWYLSTTQDMSVSGVGFLSEKSFIQGDIIELQIIMSGVLEIYSGLAKIVRVERKKSAAFYLIGAKFLGPKVKPRKAKSYTTISRNRLHRK